MLAAALWVAVLALLAQGLFALLQRAVTPAGLKTQTTVASTMTGRPQPAISTAATADG